MQVLCWYSRAMGTALHEKKGSPVKPSGHEQTGTWLVTEQMAAVPHVPGHGSTHLKPMQASAGAQSVLASHSRRQPWPAS